MYELKYSIIIIIVVLLLVVVLKLHSDFRHV